jgi:hypothetical protein
MSQRCQHTDVDMGSKCQCPHFVQRASLAATKANICDGCLHSIAWHSIPAQDPPADSSSVQTIEQILSSYTTQAAAAGSTQKAVAQGSKKNATASKAEARQEAVAGLKRSYESEDDVGSSKVRTLSISSLLS